MNYAIIGLGVVLVIVWLMSKRRNKKAEENSNLIQDFIAENPERSSAKVVRNGNVIFTHEEGKEMPLASTFLIIVAIEYAKRAAAGSIDPEEIITFDQLDNFYVPKTDGGAFMAWFKSIAKTIQDGGISIREIAKGMMDFGSHANAEWLCDKMGLVNVNKSIKELGFQNHSHINYIASSLFVGYKLFPELNGEQQAIALEGIDEEQYTAASSAIHNQLLSDPEYKASLPEVDFDIQKIWSDRLATSSVSEYVKLMEKLNSKRFLSEDVHKFLDEILEKETWLKYSGGKGGSTAFALTKAMYATDNDGNTTELAYFFNNLTIQENGKLLRAMNAFELKILTDKGIEVETS